MIGTLQELRFDKQYVLYGSTHITPTLMSKVVEEIDAHHDHMGQTPLWAV